jgi:uncharacterized protein with PIN domain
MGDVKFYFDEHIAGAVAKGLRRRGIDVLTLAEAGKLGADDEEHFAFAHEQGRVVVTHDDDFLRLAAARTDHSGVAYGSQSRAIGQMVRRLTLIAQAMTAEEMRGHVEYI